MSLSMKIGYLETIIEKKGRDEREGREMALVLSLRVNGGGGVEDDKGVDEGRVLGRGWED